MNILKTYLPLLYLKVYDFLLLLNPSTHNFIFFRKSNKLNFKNLANNTADKNLLLLDVFLTDGDVFIDIGANIGEYVNRAKKHINSSNIIAFEPLPKLNARLQKAFSKVLVSAIALSDKKAKSAFKIPYINQQKKLTRATLNTSFIENNEDKKEIIEVYTDTLDHQIEYLKISKISLIKIDVEGHEWEVIKGAKESLQKHQPILIIEIEQRHHSFAISQIIDSILSLNYNCYYFNASKLKILPVNNIDTLQNIDYFNTINYVNNFIFIPKSTLVKSFNEKIDQLTS